MKENDKLKELNTLKNTLEVKEIKGVNKESLLQSIEKKLKSNSINK